MFMGSLNQEFGHRESRSSLLQDIWDLSWGDPNGWAGRAGPESLLPRWFFTHMCGTWDGQAPLGLQTIALQVAPPVWQPQSNQASCTGAQGCKNECSQQVRWKQHGLSWPSLRSDVVSLLPYSFGPPATWAHPSSRDRDTDPLNGRYVKSFVAMFLNQHRHKYKKLQHVNTNHEGIAWGNFPTWTTHML